MKSYKKNYIGKGKEVETEVKGKKLDIVKVTLKVADVLKHKHEFEEEEYITFELARMQKPDDYGRTHTAYVSILEETEEK